MALVDLHDLADASVEVAVLARGVVLDEHHLYPFFQRQHLTRGVGVFWEVALYPGLETVAMVGEFRQLAVVVVVCQPVVGGQTDIALTRLWDKSGLTTRIESLDVLSRRLGLTDMVEHVEK